MELTTSQTISDKDNNQSNGTLIRQAIIHHIDIISNQLTHLSHVPIARVFVMREQQLIIVWKESQLIATPLLPTNDGVGR